MLEYEIRKGIRKNTSSNRYILNEGSFYKEIYFTHISKNFLKNSKPCLSLFTTCDMCV